MDKIIEANWGAKPPSFLVWFTNKVTGGITDGRAIKNAEIAGDCSNKKPKCSSASDGRK